MPSNPDLAWHDWQLRHATASPGAPLLGTREDRDGRPTVVATKSNRVRDRDRREQVHPNTQLWNRQAK